MKRAKLVYGNLDAVSGEVVSKIRLDDIMKSKAIPQVYINKESGDSFFDFSKWYIHLGIKGYSVEAVMLLFYHELSHEVHSQLLQKEDLKEFPFVLLNILEDHRIEKLASRKWDVDFRLLHEETIGSFVGSVRWEPSLYNILITLRWQKWGADISCFLEEAREYLDNFDEFVADCDKVFSQVEACETTKEVVSTAYWFYEKWFKNTTQRDQLSVVGANIDIQVDGDEVSERFEKAREDTKKQSETEMDKEGARCSSEIESNPSFDDSPLMEINYEIVNRIVNELKKIRFVNLCSDKESDWLKGRLNERIIFTNLPRRPFKRSVEKRVDKRKRILLVIDGSGSMVGIPYRNAVHFAVAMKSVFGSYVDIVLTLGGSPYIYFVKDLNDLLRYVVDGFTEHLRYTEPLINKYDYVLYITDANVDKEDEKFLERQYHNKKIYGMLAVPDYEAGSIWLPKYFKKHILVGNVIEMAVEFTKRILKEK